MAHATRVEPATTAEQSLKATQVDEPLSAEDLAKGEAFLAKYGLKKPADIEPRHREAVA